METKNMYLPEGQLLKTPANINYLASVRGLEKAMDRGAILEAVATVCDCTDMSLSVDLGCAIGVIPKEEAMYSPDGSKDIAVITRVGKPVCFKILKLIDRGEGRPLAILSRRLAQIECMEQFISRLRPGDIIPCTVTHLDPFGAFVDIACGIVSLICVDSISVSRIFHPGDRLFAGQNIWAVVKHIDSDSGRIYMSVRELLGTWEENAALFSPCSTVGGIVRSIEEYGIFVELTPNLAGLAEVREGVNVGDSCSVYIKSILPDRMKIKLVIIDSRATPICTPLKYYIDPQKTPHLDRWQYSPEGCKKIVETRFDKV